MNNFYDNWADSRQIGLHFVSPTCQHCSQGTRWICKLMLHLQISLAMPGYLHFLKIASQHTPSQLASTMVTKATHASLHSLSTFQLITMRLSPFAIWFKKPKWWTARLHQWAMVLIWCNMMKSQQCVLPFWILRHVWTVKTKCSVFWAPGQCTHNQGRS